MQTKKWLLGLSTATLLVNNAFALPDMSSAAPDGAHINPVQSTAAHLHIEQTAAHAVVNWHSFNVAAHESVHFQQPDASAMILNRVDSRQGVSTIAGQISANGRVIISNAAGIHFTPTARIDVAGLIATTANISNDNFKKGKYIFEDKTALSGKVINEGVISINAKEHGFAALIAPYVANQGTITASLGKIGLYSSTKFIMNFSGNDLVHFEVPEKVLRDVVMQGYVIANMVTFSHTHATQVLDHAVNVPESSVARSVQVRNGVIILSAEPHADIQASGRTGRVTVQRVASVRAPEVERPAANLSSYLIENYAQNPVSNPDYSPADLARMEANTERLSDADASDFVRVEHDASQPLHILNPDARLAPIAEGVEEPEVNGSGLQLPLPTVAGDDAVDSAYVLVDEEPVSPLSFSDLQSSSSHASLNADWDLINDSSLSLSSSASVQSLASDDSSGYVVVGDNNAIDAEDIRLDSDVNRFLTTGLSQLTAAMLQRHNAFYENDHASLSSFASPSSGSFRSSSASDSSIASGSRDTSVIIPGNVDLDSHLLFRFNPALAPGGAIVPADQVLHLGFRMSENARFHAPVNPVGVQAPGGAFVPADDVQHLTLRLSESARVHLVRPPVIFIQRPSAERLPAAAKSGDYVLRLRHRLPVVPDAVAVGQPDAPAPKPVPVANHYDKPDVPVAPVPVYLPVDQYDPKPSVTDKSVKPVKIKFPQRALPAKPALVTDGKTADAVYTLCPVRMTYVKTDKGIDYRCEKDSEIKSLRDSDDMLTFSDDIDDQEI